MLCSSYYSHNNFQRDIKLTKRIFSFSWYPLTLGLGHNSSTHLLVIVTQTLVYLLIGCERFEVLLVAVKVPFMQAPSKIPVTRQHHVVITIVQE